jgi:hypothetical protein
VLISTPSTQHICSADVEAMASGRDRDCDCDCDCAVGHEAPCGARPKQVSVACYFPHADNKGHLDSALGTGSREDFGLAEAERVTRAAPVASLPHTAIQKVMSTDKLALRVRRAPRVPMVASGVCANICSYALAAQQGDREATTRSTRVGVMTTGNDLTARDAFCPCR